MDALLFLGLLIALALASLRWGADSRIGYTSKEQLLASRGLSWEDGSMTMLDHPYVQSILAQQRIEALLEEARNTSSVPPRRRRTLRAWAARLLRHLADWVDRPTAQTWRAHA